MPKWLSAQEVDSCIWQLSDPRRLMSVYALALFADCGFHSGDFEPDDRWAEAVVLTKHGEEHLQRIAAGGISLAEPLSRFTLFRLFYHTDLIVDHDKTNTELLLRLLAELHADRRVIWPYAFGNRLYHKFNDTCQDNRTNHLNPDAAASLLKDTPQGVYQIGDLLSGPLGFFHSTEDRVLPPTTSLPLWHCADPGCRRQHFVRLEEPDNDAKRARETVARYTVDNLLLRAVNS